MKETHKFESRFGIGDKVTLCDYFFEDNSSIAATVTKVSFTESKVFYDLLIEGKLYKQVRSENVED